MQRGVNVMVVGKRDTKPQAEEHSLGLFCGVAKPFLNPLFLKYEDVPRRHR